MRLSITLDTILSGVCALPWFPVSSRPFPLTVTISDSNRDRMAPRHVRQLGGGDLRTPTP
jgi:hypothetical protein